MGSVGLVSNTDISTPFHETSGLPVNPSTDGNTHVSEADVRGQHLLVTPVGFATEHAAIYCQSEKACNAIVQSGDAHPLRQSVRRFPSQATKHRR